MCEDFRKKLFSEKNISVLIEWFMQRDLLERCDWRDPVKLIKILRYFTKTIFTKLTSRV